MSKLSRLSPSNPAARATAERWAQLDGVLAASRATRQAAIAATNAAADAVDAPIIEEMDQLRAALEPWYRRHIAALTGGKRKSVELGGCMLALLARRASLAVDGDEDAVAATLAGKEWGKPLVRVTPRLDKAAILKALTDKVLGPRLTKLGFGRSEPAETFNLARVDQPGVASAA